MRVKGLLRILVIAIGTAMTCGAVAWAAEPAETHIAHPDIAKVQADADRGDADAQFRLGSYYAAGKGVPRDLAKAAEFYKQSAARGNVMAMNNLGSCYADGVGVPTDESEAVRWYGEAAKKGSDFAADNLGAMYLDGVGVKKDAREAAKWFRKAAEVGLLVAQVHLGKLYYYGDSGFPRDYREAAKWISEAARRDDAWALNTLGVMYQEGLGVEKNPIQGLEYLRSAALKGYAKAQANLGAAYFAGGRVSRDLLLADQWLTLSAEQGEITAIKMRLQVEDAMSAADKNRAKQLVADYKASRNSVKSSD